MIFAIALGFFLLVVALVTVRRRYLVVVVTGHSMTPTFVDGQRLLARRGEPRPLAVGDVIVFAPPHLEVEAGDPQLRIKRVAALGGAAAPASIGGAMVPPAHVAIIGDNPASEDSRHLGFIPISCIVAHVARSGL